MDLTTRAASGILDKRRAIELADGLADLYEEDYVVLEFAATPPTEYDVEPAQADDTPGVTPYIIHRTTATK